MEGAWEYRQVSASANRQDDESFNDVRKRARETWETNLNDLGDQGWELVSSERDSEAFGVQLWVSYTGTMKRPVFRLGAA